MTIKQLSFIFPFTHHIQNVHIDKYLENKLKKTRVSNFYPIDNSNTKNFYIFVGLKILFSRMILLMIWYDI
jgi:hypothetical protein